jgi:hypothetical protein
MAPTTPDVSRVEEKCGAAWLGQPLWREVEEREGLAAAVPMRELSP